MSKRKAAEFDAVPYAGLTGIRYAEKQSFWATSRSLQLIYTTRDEVSRDDLLYRWEIEVMASIEKATEEIVRPAMEPLLRRLKSLIDGSATLSEDQRKALADELERAWKEDCKAKGITPAQLFELGMQRLAPRIPAYREMPGFEWSVDYMREQIEREQFV